MHLEAKRARCWKYSPEDPKSHFPRGSTFQPNWEAASTSLVFVNFICTQYEATLPANKLGKQKPTNNAS